MVTMNFGVGLVLSNKQQQLPQANDSRSQGVVEFEFQFFDPAELETYAKEVSCVSFRVSFVVFFAFAFALQSLLMIFTEHRNIQSNVVLSIKC